MQYISDVFVTFFFFHFPKLSTEHTIPPVDNVDKYGFDIDLINAIAADQGMTVEMENLEFDGLVMALQNGSIVPICIVVSAAAACKQDHAGCQYTGNHYFTESFHFGIIPFPIERLY